MWTDFDSWGELIPHIDAAHLDGPLQVGQTGELVIGGRTIKVTMAEFEDGVLFTNVMKLPGAELRAHHEVLPNPTSPTICTLRNRVHISGPTSWIFGKVIGRNMNDEHGAMLRAVAKRAAELA